MTPLRPDCLNRCDGGWVERERDNGRPYVEPCSTCQPMKARIFRETRGDPLRRQTMLAENYGKAKSWTHGGAA